MTRVLVFAAMLLCAAASDAAVTDYIGKPVADVRIRLDGVEVSDPALIEIIETREGVPLSMAEVRESMAHLFGLGLYQDVQVDASLQPGGVLLTYTLVPAVRVRRIVFEGEPAIDQGELRRLVVERHGASPSPSRAAQVVTTLQTVYRDRGYPRADISVQVSAPRDPRDAAMVFTIRPGPRVRLADISVQGAPLEPPARVLDALGVREGDPYHGPALDARLARYLEDLRASGHYEARATQLPRYTENDAAVNLLLNIEPGPRVEIAFQGDPLEESVRDRLVPIAREHSVDEDLLEDSKFGIERYFRELGFCNPRADYERTEDEGVLRVSFTIVRGPRCTIERLELTGNTAVSSVELQPLVVARRGQPFSESTLGADVARIQGYYRQRGFASVKVSSQLERRDVSLAAAEVGIRLTIAEGIKSAIRAVTFEGNATVDAAALAKAVRSAPGQPYFEPQIAADADALAVLYLNRGHHEVAVQPTPRAAADGAEVDLVFVIREGPQYLVDHVLVVGNARTRRETILREVQLKSGEPLSQQQEDETRARLTGLGLFRRVEISYLQLPGERRHRDVVITVDEAPVTTIGYGGGLEGGKRLVRSSETTDAVEEFQVAPRGFFEVSRRNLFGKDRSLNLFTRVSFRPKGISASPGSVPVETEDGGYGFNEYLARVTYGERRLFGSDADATISAGVEQGVRSSFDFNRRGASATVTRRVSRTLAVSARYGLDHTRLLNIKSNFAAQPEIDRLFPQVRLSSVSSSLIRDTRDDLLDPTTGTLVGADAELAARRIGSQVGYLKSFLQGFTYRRVPGSRATVVVLGGRLGLASGFPREVTRDGVTTVVDDIPASERFYAGGDTTVRGFALDRLGTPETIDQDGFPRGGHGLVIANAEVRVPLRGVLGAVAFIDAGNVFPTVDDIDLTELRAAAGFGLRYRSPVGPIRVDLGIKLNRRTQPNGQLERPTALHISLGQAF